MNTRTATHLFEGGLSFATPAGSPFAVQAESLSLDFEDDALTGCRVTFVVGPLEYQEVLRRWLFHLTPESRLPGGESFDPGADVRIEARLDEDLLGRFADIEGGAESAVELLTALSSDDALLASESWYALHVSQQVPLPEGLEGVLHAGYSTTWAVLPRAEGPAPEEGTLLAEVATYFAQEDLDFDYEEGDHFIQTEFEGKNGDFELYAFAREEQRQVVVYSVCEKLTPPEKRAAIAELLARANYGLILGNFELDFDDGEIRFRTSRTIGPQMLDGKDMRELIATNVSAMDLYLPAIEAVLTSDITPAGAIDEVEASSDDED
jgi:hypothetical protein